MDDCFSLQRRTRGLTSKCNVYLETYEARLSITSCIYITFLKIQRTGTVYISNMSCICYHCLLKDIEILVFQLIRALEPCHDEDEDDDVVVFSDGKDEDCRYD